MKSEKENEKGTQVQHVFNKYVYVRGDVHARESFCLAYHRTTSAATAEVVCGVCSEKHQCQRLEILLRFFAHYEVGNQKHD